MADVVYVTIEDYAQIDNSVMSLTNKSGGTLDEGAVIVPDVANESSFVTTGEDGGVNALVLLNRTVNDAAGLVVAAGKSKVLVTGNVAIGDRLVTSTTAGRAKSNGTGNGFAIATSAYSGGGLGDVDAIIVKVFDVDVATAATVAYVDAEIAAATGNGITRNVASGAFVIMATPTDTEGVDVSRLAYSFRIVDGDGIEKTFCHDRAR